MEYQVKNYGLTQDEALGLGYLGKEFAKKQLLNKYVAVKYTGETEHCDMGQYNAQKLLQEANVAVKIENWQGKMHQKSIIIDDSILVIGSMNFTKQGEIMNDENTLIVTNAPTLTTAYKKHFLQLWNSIKDGKVNNHFRFHHLHRTEEFQQKN